jgi:ATP-dependent helicase/nuclease subunit B
LDGNVKLNPYKKKANTACTYCEYRPVCQFDTTMKDNRYRILAEMDDSELWAMMGTSESKRNGDESGAS